MATFITKTQATNLATGFISAEADRLNQFLINMANSGFIGGVFNYNPLVTNGQASAAVTALQAAGWTAVLDTVAKTVTVS